MHLNIQFVEKKEQNMAEPCKQVHLEDHQQHQQYKNRYIILTREVEVITQTTYIHKSVVADSVVDRMAHAEPKKKSQQQQIYYNPQQKQC